MDGTMGSVFRKQLQFKTNKLLEILLVLGIEEQRSL